METMTPRERMMTALRNGQPDRVPAAPDFSNMIPARRTRKPFWEVYLNNDPPLWKAYIEASKYYGTDGWFIYADLDWKMKHQIPYEQSIEKRPDRRIVRTVYHTPEGDLMTTRVCPRSDPPTVTEKLIKNFKEDFKKIRYLFSDIVGYDATSYQEQQQELGELGMMCTWIGTPGLQIFNEYFHGNLEATTYAMVDYPDLFEELRVLFDRFYVQQTQYAIEAKVDSVLTGGSGSITVQSPDLWRRLSLPTLKKITRLCREGGVISGVHSCGKEHCMVKACANETDLDYINPLEIPPMGDCDLGKCKREFGHKLALMGNLHTTDVMLRGTPDLVKLRSLQAILAAGDNGGFVLSTGDQCGRDTPDENLFALVAATKEYGTYPLDVPRITDEIRRLENTLGQRRKE